MKRLFGTVATALLLASALYAAQFSSVGAKGHVIVKFDTMTGVSRPYTGPANAIRGVPGGGLPWVVESAEGELKQGGELEIEVRGLVIDPNDAVAIARGLAGTNPSATFKAIVSCLSTDASGAAVTVNVATDPFPATTGLVSAGAGNSNIRAHVSLPQPCIAPIIFVASPTGSWFSSTGN